MMILLRLALSDRVNYILIVLEGFGGGVGAKFEGVVGVCVL
jgi:hypothetical protein